MSRTHYVLLILNKPTNSVGNTVHTSTVANIVMTTNIEVSSEKLPLVET
jgi:hypothetical protein